MATRGNIGILNADGSVTGIYTHWDSYPSNNGRILVEHFKDTAKIKSLVDLGSISSLHEKVEPTSKKHSFETPEDGVVVAYHRDRGEDWAHVKPTTFKNKEEFVKQMEEFAYLWDGQKWLVTTSHSGIKGIPKGKFVDLDEKAFKGADAVGY